jgi:putative ABC transport system permease protein
MPGVIRLGLVYSRTENKRDRDQEFIKWVLFANLVAWPLAYFAAHNWLQNFAFRTTIGWKIFLISGSLALVISILTVCYQSIKPSLANPMDSLRYE